jgi:hypothetical protein
MIGNTTDYFVDLFLLSQASYSEYALITGQSDIGYKRYRGFCMGITEYSAALNPESLKLIGFAIITLYFYMRIMYIM